MACNGGCCAAFPFPASPDELRARWEGREAAPHEEQFKRDDLYIADMLIELGLEEVCERGVEFDLWNLIEPKPDPSGYTMYTCRHWDRETRLCTAYDERPQMCADFPYARPGGCEHGCGYRAPVETILTCAARDVRREARAWEKRKAEDSNPKV